MGNKNILEKDPLKENQNKESSITEGIIFCSKCGQKNSDDIKFCPSCGNSLKTIEDSIKTAAKNIKETINNNETYKSFTDVSYSNSSEASLDNTDMANFIQKKIEYYIPKFKEIQSLNKSTSWNWASFFFGFLWFLYRKMYAIGFGIIGVATVLSFIPIIGNLGNIALSVFCGLYGNILYLKHTQKQLNEVSKMNEDVKHRILLSKGGVNIALPIVILVVLGILTFIIGAIGTFMMMLPYYY